MARTARGAGGPGRVAEAGAKPGANPEPPPACPDDGGGGREGEQRPPPAGGLQEAARPRPRRISPRRPPPPPKPCSFPASAPPGAAAAGFSPHHSVLPAGTGAARAQAGGVRSRRDSGWIPGSEVSPEPNGGQERRCGAGTGSCCSPHSSSAGIHPPPTALPGGRGAKADLGTRSGSGDTVFPWEPTGTPFPTSLLTALSSAGHSVLVKSRDRGWQLGSPWAPGGALMGVLVCSIWVLI